MSKAVSKRFDELNTKMLTNKINFNTIWKIEFKIIHLLRTSKNIEVITLRFSGGLCYFSDTGTVKPAYNKLCIRHDKTDTCL